LFAGCLAGFDIDLCHRPQLAREGGGVFLAEREQDLHRFLDVCVGDVELVGLPVAETRHRQGNGKIGEEGVGAGLGELAVDMDGLLDGGKRFLSAAQF
jgi:hypothetical protein